MLYEVAIQHVEAEKRDAYVKLFSDNLVKITFPGSHDIQFLTRVEDPTRVIVIVEWDSVTRGTVARRLMMPPVKPPYLIRLRSMRALISSCMISSPSSVELGSRKTQRIV